MTAIAALENQISEARDALHRISTGAQAVSVKYEGREITYNTASVGQLRAHVSDLEQRLCRAMGRPRRRAIGVTF